MFSFLAGLSIKEYVIGALLILGMGLGIFYSGYSRGVLVTTLDYEDRMLKERLRISTANQDAKDRERITLSRLSKAESDRDQLRKQLHEQGAADPNADISVFGHDSMSRIDRIR